VVHRTGHHRWRSVSVVQPCKVADPTVPAPIITFRGVAITDVQPSNFRMKDFKSNTTSRVSRGHNGTNYDERHKQRHLMQQVLGEGGIPRLFSRNLSRLILLGVGSFGIR
jgi:hypothetical protein